MQGGRRRTGLSPFMKQSIIGLMVLTTLGFLGFLIFWVQNFSLGGRSFRLKFQFPNAGGMTPGTRVSYRGVKVGQVLSVEPEPEGVAITVEIKPANRLIPSNSLLEATQAGLIGETSIDIIPLQSLPTNAELAPPLDPNCDPMMILCNGSQLRGQEKLDVNSLIRSLLKISNILGDPEVTAALRTTFQKTSSALDTFNQLAGDGSVLLQQARDSGSIRNLNASLQSLEQAGDRVSILAERFGTLSDSLNAFVSSNENRLLGTVDNIGQASEQLRVTLGNLDPLLEELDNSAVIANLETTTANAAVLTENLRDFSLDLRDPQTILKLQQLLDSARSALQNADKITSDLDQLTGDPKLRENIMKLINGLSQLVSSTQQLESDIEYAQTILEIATELSQLQALSQLPDNPTTPTAATSPALPTQNSTATAPTPPSSP